MGEVLFRGFPQEPRHPRRWLGMKPLYVLALLLFLPSYGLARALDDQDMAQDFLSLEISEAGTEAIAAGAYEFLPSGYLAAVREGGVGFARHLVSGKGIETPVGQTALCVAFRPGKSEIWFGFKKGGVWVSEYSESGFSPLKPLDYQFDGPVDQLVFAEDGLQFGWRQRKSKTLAIVRSTQIVMEMRLLDIWRQSMRVERSDATAFAAGHLPPFGFALGGRVLVYLDHSVGRDETGAGSGPGILHDLQNGKRVGSFAPYVCHGVRGWVLDQAGERLVYGVRNGMSEWSVVSRGLAADGQETPEPVVVDPKARGGHFIDLKAGYLGSNRGRFVGESDFEEKGMRVYDLGGEFPMRTIGTEDQGAGCVGFVQGPGGQAPWILSTAAGQKGLTLWNWQGKRLSEGHPQLQDRLVTRAMLSSDQAFLVVAGWRSQGTGKAVEYTLEVLGKPQ